MLTLEHVSIHEKGLLCSQTQLTLCYCFCIYRITDFTDDVDEDDDVDDANDDDDMDNADNRLNMSDLV